VSEFALLQLFDAVVARFTLDNTVCVNLFGWRTPQQKSVTGNRICWVPGDDGELGGVTWANSRPGQNPRSLGTLGELFTVWIRAADATDPAMLENERVQYEAARTLFDAWYRAVYLHAHGTFTVESSEWMIEQNERRYGAGIRVVCSIQAKIPDEALVDANELTDLAADIATTVLDRTETDHMEGDAT